MLGPSTFIPQSSFKDYPLLSRLLELHNIPKGIYIDGPIPSISFDSLGRASPRVLTVVGSRKCTTYGKKVIEHLLSSFDRDEVVILSGLALGIDGHAHITALKNNLLTLAIPGSGLGSSVIYPSSHKHLAEEIKDAGGTLLSELDDNTKAEQWTFPARNRIMAALSDAVLIIEAEEESGTLITGRQALELGRDIGAVPGEIFSPTAQGTLALVRDGATPISSPEDLRALLHLKEKELTHKVLDLNKEEALIMELLREPKDKDLLLEESHLSLSDFMMAMTTLEMKGYIEETFGEVRKIV